ncbi:MAG: LD-carboxypeptidase [Acholeplasmataceae bacterium]|jgi:muramoyltetrapeptide carboxypeptidase LdcA involved in peptidoglycan recycling|nr:LD-carboxypeptidase [Acholeplasmataceae bacterium]
MKIPNFIKKGDTIGLVAPSFGANIEPYFSRLKRAIEFLKKSGFKIKMFGDIFGYKKGASASKEDRAKAFMDCYLDQSVDAVWSISGGELMIEILPFLDFDKLKNSKEKFFIGYSDNTNLTFLFPLLLNTVSVYAPCLTSFGMKPLDPFLKNTLKLLQGEALTQHKSNYHEPAELPEKGPLEPYTLTKKTTWINLFDEDEIKLEGRVIGGCLDILIALVGTNFDQVKRFLNRYSKDNIIWFLEAADLNLFAYKRALWQLKNSGWFNNAKGFIIGRSNSTKPILDLNVYDVTKNVLKDLDAPIIMDVDIGHVNPMLTIFAGAKMTIINNDLTSKIDFHL